MNSSTRQAQNGWVPYFFLRAGENSGGRWKNYLEPWGERGKFVGEKMMVELLKSKLHRARVTGASVDYMGSITIAANLAHAAGLREYERVLVGNMGNGQRFETYVIFGPEGVIELNGATAYLGRVGDRLTIMAFGFFTLGEADAHKPLKLLLDEANRVIGEA